VASLGVVAYLNLKAGPSIGWTVLPDDAPHEARERDYFFALAFWGWGLLAGYGAVRVAEDATQLPAAFSTARGRAALGLGTTMLPVLLNWRALEQRLRGTCGQRSHRVVVDVSGTSSSTS